LYPPNLKSYYYEKTTHISYPEQYFRAVEGDTVLIVHLDIKKEKKEDFEEINHELIFDRLADADQQAEFIGGLTRVMHPVKENEEGSLTYIVMFDPFYQGEYSFRTDSLLSRILGEEKGTELQERLTATLAGEIKAYWVTQSGH
jgi:hypothetical protein